MWKQGLLMKVGQLFSGRGKRRKEVIVGI